MVKTHVSDKIEDAAKILAFLDKNERTRPRDLGTLMSLCILTKRLHDLTASGLIEHHSEKSPLEREWYELTERGRKILTLLREFTQTAAEKEKLFSLLDQVHTTHILEFIYQKGRTRYRDMNAFVPAPTLNKRLRVLSSLKLIEYHFERLPLKREWYELTEKGRKALSILRALDLILT